MGWKPVPDLIKEIHEGDPSLRQGWPLEYWGLEPFWDDRSDWKFRYASVFQIGQGPQRMSQDRGLIGGDVATNTSRDQRTDTSANF
jgi:hypothetical protein